VPPGLPLHTSTGRGHEPASIRKRCGCDCWPGEQRPKRQVALLQLRSVIVTASEELREELRRLPLGRLLNRCRFRRSGSRTPAQLATILVLRTVSIPRSLYASIPRC